MFVYDVQISVCNYSTIRYTVCRYVLYCVCMTDTSVSIMVSNNHVLFHCIHKNTLFLVLFPSEHPYCFELTVQCASVIFTMNKIEHCEPPAPGTVPLHRKICSPVTSVSDACGTNSIRCCLVATVPRVLWS